MKKLSIFISATMLLVTAVLFFGAELNATDAHGTLKLTFIRNQVSDATVGFHTWGTGTADVEDITNNDVVQEGVIVTQDIKIYENADDSMGLIPVLTKADGTPDWDNANVKLSYGGANLSVDVSDIKGSGTKHAFIYENARDGEVAYSSTNTEKYMMFVAYYSPSYEDNLGFHSWGWDAQFTATGWGTPLQLFKTIGSAPDGTAIKGAVLETTTIGDTGALIYAGGDDSKKHGNYGDLKFFDDVEAGEPQIMAVANGSVFTVEETDNTGSMTTFTEEAFSLKFIDFGTASNGAYQGTYAPNSKNVLASLSTTIIVPKVKVEADEENDVEEVLYTAEERVELANELFTIYETNTPTNVVTVSDIDFDMNSDSVKDFVFTLTDDLEMGTSYTIKFDDGTKDCSIVINMDQEAPVIELLRSSDVIEVKWGQPFDMSKFPQYEATDDRDGDITAKVYVPAGMGTVDTSKEGDYKVTLRVTDSWGNTTDKVITFRVKK